MGVIIRQSVKATIFNYLGAFIGFLTTFFVLTKFLKPEEIGLTKIVYEVAALVASFAQLGTSVSAMRFFPYFKDTTNRHNGFFFYLLLMPAIGSLIFVTLFIVMRKPVTAFFTVKSPLFEEYYNWVVPLIVFLTFWSVFETYANILLRIVMPKFIREVGIRVLMVLLYILYACGYFGLTGLVTGMVAVYACAMCASFFYLSSIVPLSLRHDYSFIDTKMRRDIVRYTVIYVIGAIGGNIIPQLDIFMVSSNMGLNYAGIYTIALYIGSVIEVPSRSISSISRPLAAQALKEGDFAMANRLYQQVSLHQLMISNVLFLLIWINIDNIFDILPNGHIYQAGKWVVCFIGISRIVATTLEFGGTLISFSRYYHWGLYVTFFLAALTIFSNNLLIPRFGITGAALATLFTCLISYSFQQWIVLKKIGGNPYTRSTLKHILLIFVLLGVNELLPRWTTNPFADAFYRSFVVGLCGLYLVWKLQISEEVNGLLKNMLCRIKKNWQ